MDKKRILTQFVDRTGLEAQAAADILAEAQWDSHTAYYIFENLIKSGHIRPLYPSPARTAPQTYSNRPINERPGMYAGHGPVTSNIQHGGNMQHAPRSANSQWMDPYGEVRRPPLERTIQIQIEGQPGHTSQTRGQGQYPSNNPSMPVRPVSEFANTRPQNQVIPGNGHSVNKPQVQARPVSEYPQNLRPQTTTEQQGKKPTAPLHSPVIPGNGHLVNKPQVQARPVSEYPQNQRPQTTPDQQGKKPTAPLHSPVIPGNGHLVNKPQVQARPVSEYPQNHQASQGRLDEKQMQRPQSVADQQGKKATAPPKPTGGQTQMVPQGANSNQGNLLNSETKTAGNPPKSPASSPRPLKRGISKIVENESFVSAARTSLLHDIEEDSHDHMYTQTFVLPDLTVHTSDYRAFLEKDLIETSTLVSLEQAGRLNWWAEMGICQRLLPMATSGDGNCLLHAASLAMWGIHDRQLMLRKALYDTLTTKSYRQALQRRWKWQQVQQNKESGLIFSEEEWQKEWNGILKLATTKPRSLPGVRRHSSCCDNLVTNCDNGPVIYESLEDFHVFILAHVLQRAIVVVADTVLKDSAGEALAPIPFGGIYLPLECDPKSCYKSPLLLTYDAAHFSALVPMEREKSPTEEKPSLPVAIPLVDPELNLLKLHFCVDPGAGYSWDKNNAGSGFKQNYSAEDKINLLKKYLDVERLLATNLEYDSDSDKKSSGSYESDDNSGCIGKEKKKDAKVSQQIQSVTKQFGSFGKSMSKKLKKNFGSVGKALKNMGPDSGLHKSGSRTSIGSGLTQSTRLPLTIAAMAEQEQTLVWCAKIVSKKIDFHKEMIKNYMQDAHERFQQDRVMMQARGEEIRRRSMEVMPDDLKKQSKCVNPGCEMYGNPEFHYMCSACFSEQKRQALDQEKYSKYGTYPGRITSKSSNDSIQSYGKSKFYIESDDIGGNSQKDTQPVNRNTRPKTENLSSEKTNFVIDPDEIEKLTLAQNPLNRTAVNVNQPTAQKPSSSTNSSSQVRSTSQATAPTQSDNLLIDMRPRSFSHGARERTPSPDYDNVDYSRKRPVSQLPPTAPKLAPPPASPKTRPRVTGVQVKSGVLPNKGEQGPTGRACKAPGCAFFGSPEQDNYCSACYKKMKQRFQGVQQVRL